ncbi:DUF4399 domain-containing protein [Dinoroseobacter sp. S375]|uniref:DUF4399 domain-containing protein n=1 Tax=Dinoroseobacter sp. S375 TaxID=3415136 RepID=UPI003C7B9687
MIFKTTLAAIGMAGAMTLAAVAGDTPAPEGAAVYFVNLEDGATVSSPVTIVFGLEGMGVAPAGTEKDKTGHHHLLLNRAKLGEGPDGADELLYGIPADDNHIHFGGGQTQVTIDLPAGTHTMQLVLGDLNHVPHDPPIMTEVISVTVE